MFGVMNKNACVCTANHCERAALHGARYRVTYAPRARTDSRKALLVTSRSSSHYAYSAKNVTHSSQAGRTSIHLMKPSNKPWISTPVSPHSKPRLSPVSVFPWSDIEWTPLSGFLFTAGFTWAATYLVISLWKVVFDESFTPINVVKLQVGVQGPANRLRTELKEVCGGFAGSGPSAWLLVEQCVAQLQRNFDQCLLGNVEIEVTKSFGTAQRMFTELSEKEQQLAQAEAEQCFVDDAPDKGSKSSWQRLLDASPLRSVWAAGDGTAEVPDEIMVVTLLVVTNKKIEVGEHAHGRAEVLSVLGQLSGLTNDQILGAQVLWVPDEAGCYIGKTQIQQDFPGLSALT